MSLRAWYRDRLRSRIQRDSAALGPEELCRDAVVFAPHPDDETLACGGTILRKRAAGARVRVVVLTDGSASHRGLLPEDELAAIRAGEVRQACAHLGIADDDLHLLGHRDGSLRESADCATAEMAAFLSAWQPAEVFIPSPAEPPEDHATAARLVLAALRAARSATVVREYPVWLWDRWPFTAARRGLRGLVDIRRSLPHHRTLVRALNTRVDVRDHLPRKRLALAAYRSQTTRLRRGRWPILADVSAGDFEACFLQPFELFHSYRTGA